MRIQAHFVRAAENWILNDRGGTITFILEPKFDIPTGNEKDVLLDLAALKPEQRMRSKRRLRGRRHLVHLSGSGQLSGRCLHDWRGFVRS